MLDTTSQMVAAVVWQLHPSGRHLSCDPLHLHGLQQQQLLLIVLSSAAGHLLQPLLSSVYL